MFLETQIVPSHILRTLKEIGECAQLPYRNDWNAEKLLKIFQEALPIREHLSLPPAPFWEQFSLIPTDAATLKKIQICAAKLWIGGLYPQQQHAVVDQHIDAQSNDKSFVDSFPFLYTNGAYFFDCAESDVEQLQRRKAIQQLSIGDQFSYLISLSGLIKKNYPSSIFTALVRETCEIRQEWRFNLIADLYQLVEQLENSSSHVRLLVILNQIGFPTYQNVIKDVKPFIRNVADAEEIANSLLVFSKIESQQRKDIVNLLVSSDLQLVETNFQPLLERLMRANMDEIQHAIPLAKSLIGCLRDGEEWERLVGALLAYPKQEREDLCLALTEMFSPVSDKKSHTFQQILLSLKQYLPAERKKLLDLLQIVSSSYDNYFMILKVFHLIPASEWRAILELAVSHVKSNDVITLAELTQVLSHFSAAERIELLDICKPLLNVNFDIKNLKLIASIAQVKKEERAQFCRDILELTENNEVLSATIANLLTSVCKTERKQIGALTLEFIRQGVNDQQLLVRHLYRMTPREREAVIEIAKPLTNDIKETYHLCKIFDKILVTNASERAAAVALCVQFLLPQKRTVGREDLFEAISLIPAAERDDVCAKTLKLIHDSMGINHCVIVLGIIFSTIPEERELLFTQMKALKEIAAPKETELFQLLRNFAPEDRHDLINIVKEERENFPTESDLTGFVHSLSLIPKSEWRPSLKKMNLIGQEISFQNAEKNLLFPHLISYTEEDLIKLIPRVKDFVLSTYTGKHMTRVLALCNQYDAEYLTKRKKIISCLFHHYHKLDALELICNELYSDADLTQAAADLEVLISRTLIGHDRRMLVQTYLRIPAHQRTESINYFKIFIEHAIEVEITQHVEELAKIPFAEWSFLPNCLDVIQMIGTASSRVSQKISLFKKLCQFSFEERKEVVDNLRKLKMFSNQFPDIAEALFSIPYAHRKTVLDKARQHLAIKNEEAVDKYLMQLYKSSSQAESKENNLIIELQSTFAEFDNDLIQRLAQALRSVPDSDHKWIINHCALILEACHDFNEFPIIAVMSRLGEVRTHELLYKFPHLFSQLKSNKIQTELLMAFNEIPNQDFDDIVQQARKIVAYSLDSQPESLALAIIKLACMTRDQRIRLLPLSEKVMRGSSSADCLVYIEELKQFPVEELSQFIDDCLPLLRLTGIEKKEYVLKNTLQAMRTIPKEERAMFVRFIRPLLIQERGNDFTEKLNQAKRLPYLIVQALCSRNGHFSIPQSINLFNLLTDHTLYDAKDVINKTKHMFFLYNDNHYSRLVTLLLSVSAHRRDRLLKIVMDNYKAYRHPIHLALYLKLLTQVQHEDLDDFLNFSTHIINRFGYKRTCICSTFLDVRKENRASVLEILENLNLPRYLKFTSMDLVGSINEIVQQNRLPLLEHLAPYLAVAESLNAGSKLISEAIKVSDEECVDILSYLEPYRAKTMFLAACFAALAVLDRTKRKYLFQQSSFLLTRPISEPCLVPIAEELQKLKIDELEDILMLIEKITFTYTAHPDNFIEMTRLIAALRSIPFKQRKFIVEKANPYLCQIQSVLHAAKVIEALSECPNKEVDEILHTLNQFALPLIFHHKIPALIRAISHFSSEDRKMGIRNCLSYLIEINDNPLHLIAYASSLSLIHREERQEAMRLCRPLLEYHIDNFKNVNTFQLFALIPPHLRSKAAGICQGLSDKTSESAILNALFHENDIREEAFEYVFNRLEKQIEDKHFVNEVVRFIIDKYEQIGLVEEHPLFQKVVELEAILCSARGDLKNPYVLFQRLKEMTEQPLIPFEPAPQVVCGRKVRFNLNTLRANAVDHVYTKEDLPRDIPADGFARLFQSLHDRLNELPIEKQQAVAKYIREAYIHSAQRLQELFLEKPLIQNLLAAKHTLCPVIDSAAYFLFNILQFIYSKEFRLKEGEVLTEREDCLLKVSCSINECSTGQRDGIINYYNRLPVEFRSNVARVHRGSEAKVNEVIDQTMQIVMNDVLADPNILLEVEPSASGHFAPHRTLFLKNRLFKQVGYRHKLMFDLHSQIIHDALLETSLCTLMEVFFKHLKVGTVIAQLRRALPAAMRQKQIGYMDLVNVMEGCGKMNVDDYRLVFDFGDDGEVLNVTELGALRLLLGSHYCME